MALNKVAYKLFGASCHVGQARLGTAYAPKYIIDLWLDKLEYEHEINVKSNHTLKHNDREYQQIFRDHPERCFIHKPQFGSDHGYQNLYNKQLECLDIKKLITIGGDHSISYATCAASLSKYKENLHVVWVDAHADIHTPETSNSNNTHGMPVSSLMGFTDLLKIDHYKMKPEQITYLGLRDVDSAEQDLLDSLNIEYFTSSQIKTEGIENIMKDVKNKISNKKVHLSFDVDALDPSIMPSTGTLVPKGLSEKEVSTIIKEIKTEIISADITEFNPFIGTGEEIIKSGKVVINLMEDIIM